METVTISLETYNSMKSQIESLTKENQKKQIEIIVQPEWYRTLAAAACIILGTGLWFSFLTAF